MPTTPLLIICFPSSSVTSFGRKQNNNNKIFQTELEEIENKLNLLFRIENESFASGLFIKIAKDGRRRACWILSVCPILAQQIDLLEHC
jgi:hypothetical protein